MRGLAHVSSFIACGIILLTECNLILIVTVLTTAVATRFFFNALRKLLLDSSKIFFLVLCVLGYGNAGEKKKTHTKARRKEMSKVLVMPEVVSQEEALAMNRLSHLNNSRCVTENSQCYDFAHLLPLILLSFLVLLLDVF